MEIGAMGESESSADLGGAAGTQWRNETSSIAEEVIAEGDGMAR